MMPFRPIVRRILRFLPCIAVLCTVLHAQPDRRVILVIIDGARYSETLGDPAGTYIPRMRALAAQGVVVDTMLNDGVTYTKRAIPAIWCGSWSVPQDTTVNGFPNQYATAPTVWEYFRKARGFDSTHAIYVMKQLSSPWIQSFHPDYGPAYWPWYILKGTTDTDVWDNAKSKLLTYHPDFALIYLADVDGAPGRGGWDAYTRAIEIADSIVGELWDVLQTDPIYRNTTTLMVTNDHGRHLDGVSNGFLSHGDGCMGCRHIMFLAIGSGVKQGVHTSIARTIPDITPTIGAILDFPAPHSTGAPMTELLVQTGLNDEPALSPATFALLQNYPNPFNGQTKVGLRVSHFGLVDLRVFDLLGREMGVILHEERPAGEYTVSWDASAMPSGVYYFRMKAGEFRMTRRMVVLR